jgi:putative membrane-bound dehydrogenase-like protein
MQRLVLCLLCFSALAQADDLPKVLDDRLKLELIAEAPVVRTPTGITIDDKGRVYVIESHTHFPPKDYDGPKTDRILRFEKKGEKWESSVFLEGKKHTMGCGFHPNGWLYIATRNLICRVKDKNDNGKIDENEHDCLVVHSTKGDYPHNGLSGFAFDFAGNVYFGQGENLGVDYTLGGQDGTSIKSGGEGGNIYCCDAEGKKLRRVATGFWNPFHLYMDPFGRLFAVDNDPDSRPPCRLLHVVEGGDYGYRFRNGRKGTHPFTSWNGELPGTLPMVSGTGEAPSGIIGGSAALLPDLDVDDLIATSWGDHRIEVFPLRGKGANYKSVMKPLVTGGESFRPVGIAAHQDGSLWFTDWVDKSYELHSKGRLWRLSARSVDTEAKWGRDATKIAAKSKIAVQKKSPDKTLLRQLVGLTIPSDLVTEVIGSLDDALTAEVRRELVQHPQVEDKLKAFALGGTLGNPPPLPVGGVHDPKGLVLYAATRRLDPTQHRDRLLELVGDPDPFVQQSARWALRTAAEELAGFAFDKETRPAARLGIALVLAEANSAAGQKRIPELLKDSDPLVRFVAIKWIGESKLKDVWNEVKDDLEKRLATRQELEAFLATSAFLSDEKYDPGKEAPGEEFVVKMLLDKKTSPERQAFLLRMLRADHPALSDARLQQWIEGKDAGLRLAALQTISQRDKPPGFLNLGAVSQDDACPVEERLEAIAAMASKPRMYDAILNELMNSKHPLIATQAGRTIRTDDQLAAANSIAFGPEGRTPADRLAEWRKIMDKQPGDPKSGEYVFHHRLAQCSRCHEAGGRGAAIGPNLTGIGKTMSRERLIQSIFQPSKEIAPQFAVWEIVTTDGKIRKGMYVGEEVDGTVIYADEKGERFKIHPRDVEQRTQQKTSIMPDGLPYRLTDQELRDLLAYLESK